MMNTSLANRIGYCGLICELDSCYSNCPGCKMPDSNCGDKDCFQRKCCVQNSLAGCWECESFPCDKGYFSETNPSRGQFVGCVRYIKQVGILGYIEKIKSNSIKGFKYGMNGFYANKSEEEVLELLK